MLMSNAKFLCRRTKQEETCESSIKASKRRSRNPRHLHRQSVLASQTHAHPATQISWYRHSQQEKGALPIPPPLQKAAISSPSCNPLKLSSANSLRNASLALSLSLTSHSLTASRFAACLAAISCLSRSASSSSWRIFRSDSAERPDGNNLPPGMIFSVLASSRCTVLKR